MSIQKIRMIPPNYTDVVHPETSADIVIQDPNNRFVTDAEKSKWNAKQDNLGSGDVTQYLRGDGTWASPPGTMYSEIAEAEILAGTSSVARSVTARRLNYLMNNIKAASASNADTVGGFTVAKSVPSNALFTDTVYTHPSSHPASIITQDANNRLVTDVEKASWNAKASTAISTASANGLMSAADKSKLDGIQAGAKANVQSDWSASSGDAFILNKPTLGTAAALNTGTASGNVPILGTGGKLDTAVLPAIAITDTFVVATQSAMLALTAEIGDVAVRTDESKSYILKASPASVLANWQLLMVPEGAVTSVNSKSGAVTITKSDIGLENADNTSDALKNVLSATKLTTARTINGVPFDGTANITIADNTKLPASSYTAADILAKLLTVDGSGSGIDAQYLAGNSASDFALASHGTHVTYGTTVAGLIAGGPNVIGTSSQVSRADHVHAMPSFPTSLPANGGNADTVSGFTVGKSVPSNAVFTDTVYTHPSSHPASMITQDASNRFVTDAEKSTWNSKGTSNLALGTTSATAFRGDYGNVAYAHSQAAHAPSGAQANQILTSGDGMAAWTATSGDLTIALGTPATLTNATTNAVTATSHTHAVTFPVSSVAGKTGAVTLTADDVGAASASHTHSYLPLSGGTVSGLLTATAMKIGSSRVTISSSAPAGPATGDIWIGI